MTISPAVTSGHPARTAARLHERLDQALVTLAAGNRRAILELVRDDPGALGAMAGRFGMSNRAVSQDLSMFHGLEHEAPLEALAAGYDAALLDAALLDAGSRVLDVGCGSGVSTRAAARAAPNGTALGIDISAALVKRGRERSRLERVANAVFEQADAEVHRFEPASFDVVISRFGAMYFAHPAVAFTNIRRALRPGGRLALVAWRDLARNEWMSAVGQALAQGRTLPPRLAGGPGAFGLAEEDEVRRVLAEAGFNGIALEEVRAPVSLGADVAGAYAFVSTQALARDLLNGLDGATRARALGELRDVLADHWTPGGVLFGSTCWIITARRP